MPDSKGNKLPIKKYILLIVAVIFLMVLSMNGVYRYVNKLILQSNIETMRELGEHDQKAISAAINKRVTDADNLADSLASQSILSIQELHENLVAANYQLKTKRIYLLGSDGKFYSSNGTAKEDAEYAQMVVENPNGFLDRLPSTSKKFNDGLLLIGRPISGFSVEGVKFTYIITETKLVDLTSELVTTSYNGQGHSFVIDKDGYTIVSPEGQLNENAFDNLRKFYKLDGDTIENYIQRIINDPETAVTIENNGEKCISLTRHTPEGWILVSICPESVFAAQSNKITSLFAFLSLFFVAAVAVTLIFILRTRSRKLLEERYGEIKVLNEQLVENQTKLEESVSEQESQLAEITNLNNQLEENQAQLEEAAAELEAHIEEVTALNAQLSQNQECLEKAKEEAEGANNAKTAFLFNMSHDIRTPMNAIIGFRDLLEKHQDEPEKRQDYLRKIEDASTVLLSIINNVLEMARIEKGTIEIDETAWSAEQFNDTLYSVFHEMMKEKGLTFTRQVEVQNSYVFCDPIKLREIFINILSNAYKYTNAGGSVNMHLKEIPSNREGWALYQTTITDTGIGMAEEYIPHIFEEFSRENNTTDAKIEGTGLGMPIVKRLVEMLDGTIEVHSKKGEGSTFIVTIPHRIAEKSNLVEHAGVEVDPKLFAGKHILLAEDNELNAEIAMEILGEVGFIIDRAEDGAICVDILKKASSGYYDLILMDIQMPNMNGYEATRAIRQLGDSSKANIKILAMTANAFEEDKREAFRAGMNGHLAKPINVPELMKALAGILG